MKVVQRKEWLAGGALVLVTLVAYLPVLQAGFVWDDDVYVEDNDTLRSLDGLRRIWVDPGATPHHYFPMVHTSFWLEYHVWGLNPAGYHLVNVLLHALSAVLLWRTLRVVRVPGPWLAGAIFAVHPVMVESVAWITERKNVLSGAFFLASALAYLHWASARTDEPGRERSAGPYVASLGLFACALLAKTLTCTLPAALLLVLWWKRDRLAWSDVRPLLPFFVLGAALALLSVRLEANLGHVGPMQGQWDQSFVERCLIAGRALWFYAGKLAWPDPLIFVYPRWPIDAGSWPQYLYPIAALGGLAALWSLRGKLGKGPLVAALYFVGSLFPLLGFFKVFFMRYSFVQDHFQYLASIGPIALVASGVALAGKPLGRRGRLLVAAAVAIALVTLGTLTWSRARVFHDRETLWRDTVAGNPEAWMAHVLLGTEILDREPEEAIDHFLEAARLNPVAVEPHFDLGLAYQSLGRPEEAIERYRRAVEIDPGYAEAHNNLGTCLAMVGRLDEAIRHFRRSLELRPDDPGTRRNLGRSLMLAGRFDEALEHLEEAARGEPDRPQLLSDLATILATHPDPAARDPDRAIRLAEKALALATEAGDRASADRYQRQLAGYRANRSP